MQPAHQRRQSGRQARSANLPTSCSLRLPPLLLLVLLLVVTAEGANLHEDARLLRRESLSVLPIHKDDLRADQTKSAALLLEDSDDPTPPPPPMIDIQEMMLANVDNGLEDQSWLCAAESTYIDAAARCEDVGVLDRYEYEHFPSNSPCGCSCCRRPVKSFWECYPKYDNRTNQTESWCQNVGVEDGFEYQLIHRVMGGANASVCGCECCRRNIELCPGSVTMELFGEFKAFKQDVDGLMTYKSANKSVGDQVTLAFDRWKGQWKIVDNRRLANKFPEVYECSSRQRLKHRCPTRASGGWRCMEADADDFNITNLTVLPACSEGYTVTGAEEDAKHHMGSFIVANLQAREDMDYRPIFQNSHGKYLYYHKGSNKWQIGDSYTSGVAEVTCAQDSLHHTCPHECKKWQVQSEFYVGSALDFGHLVKSGDCPPLMYISGSKLSGLQSKFGIYSFRGIYGGIENSGRPIYEHKNGDYLYYWAPTRNWRVGPNYTSAVANISSAENEYDFCPHKMVGWNGWVDGLWSEDHYFYASDAEEVCPDEIFISGHPESFHYTDFGIYKQTGEYTKSIDEELRPIFRCWKCGHDLFYSSEDQAWHIGTVDKLYKSWMKSTPYRAPPCPTRIDDWTTYFPKTKTWSNSLWVRAKSACRGAYRIHASENVPEQYLGEYSRLDTQVSRHQVGRPIYRNEHGMFLYYWNETQDWHIGPQYANPSGDSYAQLRSLPFQDATCPDEATRWRNLRSSTGSTAVTAASIADTRVVVFAMEDKMTTNMTRTKHNTTENVTDYLFESPAESFSNLLSVRRRRQGQLESQLLKMKHGVKRLCFSDHDNSLEARYCHPGTTTETDQSWHYNTTTNRIALLSGDRCVTRKEGDDGSYPSIVSEACESPTSTAQNWTLADFGMIMYGADPTQCIRMDAMTFATDTPLILVPCNTSDIYMRWH
eukprot:CAMPEP_0206437662 /NCGR_PEP_ID=MMETSP0324_2-20121206/11171_1 /ASSEMBLY_ACC=CAM_ASM_000836 /TAXON_ID=2866 /ORGANISM="Crypthecodinium cohnii, Strain Seligo" /LENGTH=937 /DNA_ID=CAMNT_0053904979 /DNA_START=76 /DNA_END=2889 /DNA_ORIENTATION=-